MEPASRFAYRALKRASRFGNAVPVIFLAIFCVTLYYMRRKKVSKESSRPNIEGFSVGLPPPKVSSLSDNSPIPFAAA